jgi:diaminopimelate epimerase
MTLHFSKYHGTGNDFIILDNLAGNPVPGSGEIAFLCNRHLGIGADGLMIVEKKKGFDFNLRYFNSDGLESSMCGNGGRCVTAFAHKSGIIRNRARFYAADGTHEAEILNGNSTEWLVKLKMKNAVFGSKFDDGCFIDTGSPHFVKFVDSVENVNVREAGKILRHDRRFAPEGTNVDFAEANEKGIFVRTYERGVEDETLSCGTGVTATALVSAFLDPGHAGSYRIKTPGGLLGVSFQREGVKFSDIFLEGPARFVFTGQISF